MLTLTLILSIFLFIPFVQESVKERSFYYVAHRGASYLAPENTLASMELAWTLGADAAECDIMLTADNQVLLFHDENTKRLTGENLRVQEATWQQLKSLRIIPRESNLPEYENEPIPLLEEVLASIPDTRMLVIEIKTGPEILPHLQEVISQHWTTGTIAFIAFDFETIRQAKTLFPEIPCYFLSMYTADLNKHFDAVVECGLDGLDLRHNIIDEKVMERCRASRLDVWCWTVNDPETALKMKQLGVSALTTDRPAWLKKQLGTIP